jgi:anti-sigma B factor antagonist
MSLSEFMLLEGELTIYAAAQQHACLMNALRQSTPPPGLDLANIKEIDTAGVQLLLMMRNALVGESGTLALSNTTPELREVLSLLRLDGRFGFVDAPLAPEPKRRKKQAK